MSCCNSDDDTDAASRIERERTRSCTDVLWLCMFILFWFVMVSTRLRQCSAQNKCFLYVGLGVLYGRLKLKKENLIGSFHVFCAPSGSYCVVFENGAEDIILK